MARDLLQTVFGHHAPVLEIVVAGPVLLVPLKGKTELGRGRLDHADALRHHLFPDPITSNHCDLVLCHVRFSHSDCRTALLSAVCDLSTSTRSCCMDQG